MSPLRRALLFAVALVLAGSGTAAHAGLFVTDFVDNGVLEYDSTTGAFVKTFADAGGFSFPNGLVFGPNGDLFVSNSGSDAVLEFNGTTGAFVKTFTSGGEFNSPDALVFGPNGDLFVSAFAVPIGFNPEVFEFNGTTGAFVKTFASLTTGAVLPFLPEGLAFGPNGDLFITDFAGSAVDEYNGTTGAFVQTFASGGGLDRPLGLVFDPNGDLFVSSVNSNAVLEYNGTTGAFVKTFASGGGLSVPAGLLFGPNGDLFVTGEGNNAVLEYNGSTGAFIQSFASGGGLRVPEFLTFSPEPEVPEPSSLLLAALGTLTVLASASRKRAAASPGCVGHRQAACTREREPGRRPEGDSGQTAMPKWLSWAVLRLAARHSGEGSERAGSHHVCFRNSWKGSPR